MKVIQFLAVALMSSQQGERERERERERKRYTKKDEEVVKNYI
jgi:hypothetical protein